MNWISFFSFFFIINQSNTAHVFLFWKQATVPFSTIIVFQIEKWVVCRSLKDIKVSITVTSTILFFGGGLAVVEQPFYISGLSINDKALSFSPKQICPLSKFLFPTTHCFGVERSFQHMVQQLTWLHCAWSVEGPFVSSSGL